MSDLNKILNDVLEKIDEMEYKKLKAYRESQDKELMGDMYEQAKFDFQDISDSIQKQMALVDPGVDISPVESLRSRAVPVYSTDSNFKHNKEGEAMHYRNGREAKNGDKIVKVENGKIVSFGVLHSAEPGNDYCNGQIAVIQVANDYACMVDCLRIDDIEELLAKAGLDKRPEGK